LTSIVQKCKTKKCHTVGTVHKFKQ